LHSLTLTVGAMPSDDALVRGLRLAAIRERPSRLDGQG
jgi:hypothetical protein